MRWRRLAVGAVAVLSVGVLAAGVFSRQIVDIQRVPLGLRVLVSRAALVDPRFTSEEREIIRASLKAWSARPDLRAEEDFRAGRRCVSVVFGFTGVYPHLGGLEYDAVKPDDYKDCYWFGSGCVDETPYHALNRDVGLWFSGLYNRRVSELAGLRVPSAGA